MFMWISILLLQGIASFACGCGLEDICRDGRIMSRSKKIAPNNGWESDVGMTFILVRNAIQDVYGYIFAEAQCWKRQIYVCLMHILRPCSSADKLNFF